MDDKDKLNKELDKRIEKLRKDAAELEDAGERVKSVDLKYIVCVFIVLFLALSHIFVRSLYASSIQSSVRDSVALALADNDSLVLSFNNTLDSLRAENKAKRHETRKDTHKVSDRPKYAPKNVPIQVVDINTATAEELMKIRGIGQARAKGIIKYREVLGGYYSPDQLYEVYCMDSSVVRENMRSFKCSQSAIIKIDINHIEPRSLYHPYLKHDKDYALLNAIKKRLYSGTMFNSFAEIEALPEYNAAYHSQARYYLEFK